MKLIAILLALTGFSAFVLSIADSQPDLMIPGLVLLGIALALDVVARLLPKK